MTTEKTLVMNSTRINQSIQRIAYQILENNLNEEIVYLVGIEGQGYVFAKRVLEVLKETNSIKVELGKITMDKKNPNNGKIDLSFSHADLEGKSIILVDDVLNSGKTLIYAVKEILNIALKKLTTIVLVDRIHRKYPIKADFVGMSLSTTIQEHIEVNLSPGNENVYLV